MDVPDDRLFLVSGVPSRDILTDAAVNFFLAATECRVISSIVSKVEHSTPVEVYWIRRANVGDVQVCVDTLTLSRRPLPLDSEQPSTVESGDVDKHVKRGDSPYDNVVSTADDSLPQYGFLAQLYPPQSSNVLPPHTEALRAEAQLHKPFTPAFSAFRPQPNVTGQAAKSPLSNVGTIFQSRSPEAPPPVYSAAKDMPSAQLQNISCSQRDEVDALADILKNVDPRVMEDATHRQQIMSQLENYSSSSSGSGNTDLSPKFVGRHVPTNLADTGSVGMGWQCQLCTYSNENNSRVCEMCRSEKM